jgi:hypothetical protein
MCEFLSRVWWRFCGGMFFKRLHVMRACVEYQLEEPPSALLHKGLLALEKAPPPPLTFGGPNFECAKGNFVGADESGKRHDGE